MKTGTIVFLIIAAVLVIIGALIFTSALFAADFNISKISTVKYQTNTYTADGTFENIIIECESADVTFKASTDDVCRIECYENEKVTHSVTVDGGTLHITADDERKWYDHITFFGFSTPKVTVYLPNAEYSSLSVDLTTGDVHLPRGFKFWDVKIDSTTGDVECYSDVTASLDISLTTGDIDVSGVSVGKASLTVTTGDVEAENLKLTDCLTFKSTTGDVELENVTCKSLNGHGSTGSIKLENVIAEEKLSVKTTTGDVIFYSCDAEEMYVKTTTGDVRGTLLSEKIFIAETSTGKIDVPKTVTGGRCEITTTTGDVGIRVK